MWKDQYSWWRQKVCEGFSQTETNMLRNQETRQQSWTSFQFNIYYLMAQYENSKNSKIWALMIKND